MQHRQQQQIQTFHETGHEKRDVPGCDLEADVPLVIAYIVPLLNAVGPPATEEMRIMRAEPAAFSKG